jgi:hypothetical protein
MRVAIPFGPVPESDWQVWEFKVEIHPARRQTARPRNQDRVQR